MRAYDRAVFDADDIDYAQPVALFPLPTEELSDILEDETGFHIIRVLEREEAGKVPFTKAQVEIRDKIKEQRQEEKVKTYIERLKRETYVWNYFE